MSLPEIVPGLYLLTLGISNAYLWRSDDGVTLVDTGPAGSGPAITDALTGLGLRREDVRRIVLTHVHDDHSGSAAEVRGWNRAPAVAGAGDAPVVRGDRPGPEPVLTAAERDLFAGVSADLPRAPACRPVREVLDGDDLDDGGTDGGTDGGMVVVGVPGHTPGSIAVHLPAMGVLLTGDTVAEYEGRLILGPFTIDRAQAWSSLQRLAALEADVVCPGHGRPVAAGAATALPAATDPLGRAVSRRPGGRPSPRCAARRPASRARASRRRAASAWPSSAGASREPAPSTPSGPRRSPPAPRRRTPARRPRRPDRRPATAGPGPRTSGRAAPRAG